MRQIGRSKHSIANSILKSGALKSRPGALQQRNTKHKLQMLVHGGTALSPKLRVLQRVKLAGREEKKEGDNYSRWRCKMLGRGIWKLPNIY